VKTYKQYLKNYINEVHGKKVRSFGDPKDALIFDKKFLQKTVDNKGVWVDDESKVYFDEPKHKTTFMSPDDISKKFAGGGGIKTRRDIVNGKDFLSAGSAHRRDKDYRERKIGLKKYVKDEKPVEDRDPREISPLSDFVLTVDKSTLRVVIIHFMKFYHKQLSL